jgi:hypothetical protein
MPNYPYLILVTGTQQAGDFLLALCNRTIFRWALVGRGGNFVPPEREIP